MRSYALPGLTLSIEGFPPEVVSSAESSFRLCAEAAVPADLRLVARACFAEEMDAVLPAWLAPVLANLPPSKEAVMLYGPGGDVAAAGSDAGACSCAWLSADRREMAFVAVKRRKQRTPLAVQSVLTPVLREAFAARNRILLHGAALLCPNGVGICLLADGGGGKTTSALAVLRQGARLLSDDILIVSGDEGGLIVRGMLEPLNLTPRTISFFEELSRFGSEPPGSTPSGKVQADPASIYGPDCLAAEMAVDVLYFLRLAGEEPALRPISTPAALGKLIKAHTFARNQRLSDAAFEVFHALLERAAVYELHTGPDPCALGEWIVRHCAEHARHTRDSGARGHAT